MEEKEGAWRASDSSRSPERSRKGGTQRGSQKSASGKTEGGLPFWPSHPLLRPPRERRCQRRGESQRDVEVAPPPSSSSLSF